jgi:uracil-DNA glycosylase
LRQAKDFLGGRAQQAINFFEFFGKRIFDSYHPARRNKNNPKTKAQYNLIPTKWREVYDCVLGKGVDHAKNI